MRAGIAIVLRSGERRRKSGERIARFAAPGGKRARNSGAPGRTSNASCARPANSFIAKCGTPAGIGAANSIAATKLAKPFPSSH